MNKISKKIVALATMAAFVLTLVPAAAFGAPAASSSVTVEETELELGANENSVQTYVNLDLADADKGENIVVWVTEGTSLSHYVTFGENTEAGVNFYPNTSADNDAPWKNYGIYANNESGQYKIPVSFKAAGNYTVHVASNIYSAAKPSENMYEIGDGVDVTVTNAETVVDSYTVTADSYDVDSTVDSATIQLPEFVANGNNGLKIDVNILNKYADDQDGTAFAIKDQDVTFTSDQVDLYKNATSTTNVVSGAKTDSDGNVSFYAIPAAGAKGVQTITLSCDGRDYTIYLNLTKTDEEVASIEAVDNGEKLVNADESNISDAVQFVAKNAAGEVISADLSDAQVRVTKAPTKSNAAFELVPVANSKAYGLAVKSGALLEGDYSIHVTLNDKYVDASFTVAKYGKTVDSKIVIKDENGNVVEDNVYANNGTYTGIVYVVDENGLEKVYKNSAMLTGAIKGDKAVVNFKGEPSNGKFTFEVTDDSKADKDDNALIGTEIEFIAVYPSGGVNTTATVTVADSKNIENLSLAFDKENGKVGQSNSVKVTLVNENGDVVKKNSVKTVATVVEKSNEDANVTVNVSNLTNGEGTLTIFSDKETTVDVLVYARESADNSVVYGGTLTYAIGEQDIPVDTTVVMTIGSSDFVINDKVITKEDSAPYIANDRTYVPFRALGEALGAEVNWDNDARTVTYTLGKTEVVLTIDETTYTVNGEEKTMDVAPVITGDRTYVPVRFVGEALGFKVVALSATDGTTSSVVFQK